jgi:chemotaxis methyl-accepting protein methylase
LRALPAFAARWFTPIENGMRIERRMTEAIEWRRINLVDAAAVAALPEFDVVLCRNVLIYFSDEMVRVVLAGIRRALRADGRLVVGTSASRSTACATSPTSSSPGCSSQAGRGRAPNPRRSRPSVSLRSVAPTASS